MRERVAAAAAISWRACLSGAIVALALAAFATEVGAAVLSRFAGTVAFAAALLGAVGGLITEIRSEARSSRSEAK